MASLSSLGKSSFSKIILANLLVELVSLVPSMFVIVQLNLSPNDMFFPVVMFVSHIVLLI